MTLPPRGSSTTKPRLPSCLYRPSCPLNVRPTARGHERGWIGRDESPNRAKPELTIHGTGATQILYELIDPNTWAAAAAEAIVAWPGSTSSSGVFAFANERAVCGLLSVP